MKNVLHVPDFKFNLLSVSQITKALSCVVLFFPEFCVFQGLYNGKVLGIGRERDGLYLLQEKTIPITNVAGLKHNTEGILWHLRLGHPSTTVMNHIASLNKCADSTIQEKCHICPLAKHHKLSFPNSCSNTVACFELLHVDCGDPTKCPPMIRNIILLL